VAEVARDCPDDHILYLDPATADELILIDELVRGLIDQVRAVFAGPPLVDHRTSSPTSGSMSLEPEREHMVGGPVLETSTLPDAASGGRTRPAGRPLRHLASAVFTAVTAVVILPDLLFELDRRTPFAQLVAFRPVLLLGAGALLVLLLLVAVFTRRALPFAAGLAAVLAVGAVLVGPRVVPDPLPTEGTPLTVLTFNALNGQADLDALAELIRTERPDLIALTESGETYRSRLAPLLEPLGYRSAVAAHADRTDIASVTTFAAAGIGEFDVRRGEETAWFPYLEITGGALGDLRFVTYHAVIPAPRNLPPWESDLALLAQWCAGPTPAIVAGDFNATLDHSAFRAGMAGCVDAAEQRGAGLIPTWGDEPRMRGIGPQIDHVLATNGIDAETFAVHGIPGSDHRAVLTRLRLPA
jgi:endonuclease/exonuclease/phosphatase (EEP) superfamily protein YafD